MPSPRALSISLFLVVVALPALAPSGAAAALEVAFGSVVKAGDVDLRPPSALPAASVVVCFLDRDSDGALDVGEPWFARTQPCAAPSGYARLVEGDLRLSGASAGRPVARGDAELGEPVAPLAAPRLRYADLSRDGRFGPGDGLYFMANAARAFVAPGDLRLLSVRDAARGSFVLAGDADEGVAALELPALAGDTVLPWRFWDLDLDARWGAGDVLYLDLDGSASATVLDMRVTPYATLEAGLVLAGDPDALPSLGTLSPRAALCFADPDGNRAYDSGSSVYLKLEGCLAPDPRAAATPVRVGDLRLTGPRVGSFVAPGDPDVGVPVWLLTGEVRYSDLNGDGQWSRGDALYLHTAPGRTAVSQGDVRLTRHGGFGPGGTVLAGDSDLGFLTRRSVAQGYFYVEFPGALRFWGASGDGGFGGGDVLYLDVDASTSVTLQDVRLTPLGNLSAGSLVEAGDPDARPVLEGPTASATLCFLDADGNGTLEAGEPLLFQAQGCGRVRAEDLWLSGSNAGTRVRNAAPFAANATLPLPGGVNIRFYDADGEQAWGPLDTLYLHLAPGRAAVAEGDLRLTGFGSLLAGSFVATRDGDSGLATIASRTAASLGNWRAWDLDADRRLGGEDLTYLDMDASGTVTPGDVRLGRLEPEAGGMLFLATQVPRLQLTIQALEATAERQSQELASLRNELEAKNASIEQLIANLTALEEQNARLAAELEEARQALASRPMPGFGALAALAGIGAALLVLRRRA